MLTPGNETGERELVMKHPSSRSERRHNGNVWRNRQRFIILHVWYQSRYSPVDPTKNNMWWARKQSSAHGNRCCCHYEKFSRKEIRKRRRALDSEITFDIRAHQSNIDE